MNTNTELHKVLAEYAELKDKYISLQQENESLLQEKLSLSRTCEELKKENQTLICKNAHLQEDVDFLKWLHFCRHSEQQRKDPRDATQGHLFNEAESFRDEPEEIIEPEETPVEDIAARTKAPAKPRKKCGRKPLPEGLPRREITIDLTEAERTCACGTIMEKIGEEVSEKMEFVPAHIRVLRFIRSKYACPKCEGTEDSGPTVRIAPMPPQLIPQGIVTPSLVTFLAINKFVDAMPLYRQSCMLSRWGVDIARSTMCNWLLKTAEACAPLLERLRRHLLDSEVINMDETPVQVLNEEERKNTSLSYMWVTCGGKPGPKIVLFTYSPTRSGAEAAEILGDFRGFLQTDGYKGYAAVGNRDGITHVGCLVHVRRKFVEAAKVGDKKLTGTANAIVNLIAKVYHIEKLLNNDLQQGKITPDGLTEARQIRVKPILDDIHARMLAAQPKVPPSTLLGRALNYGLKQWPLVCNYLLCPYLTPDNNIAENAIRPFVVGRKNWLFSGSPNGAAASALFYSLIETAKANGVNPQDWLLNTLEKLPSTSTDAGYEALMPWNFS